MFATLKLQPAWSELPLIILTSGGESRLTRLLDLAATAAGSVMLLEEPDSHFQVADAVRPQIVKLLFRDELVISRLHRDLVYRVGVVFQIAPDSGERGTATHHLKDKFSFPDLIFIQPGGAPNHRRHDVGNLIQQFIPFRQRFRFGFKVFT